MVPVRRSRLGPGASLGEVPGWTRSSVHSPIRTSGFLVGSPDVRYDGRSLRARYQLPLRLRSSLLVATLLLGALGLALERSTVSRGTYLRLPRFCQ